MGAWIAVTQDTKAGKWLVGRIVQRNQSERTSPSVVIDRRDQKMESRQNSSSRSMAYGLLAADIGFALLSVVGAQSTGVNANGIGLGVSLTTRSYRTDAAYDGIRRSGWSSAC